MSENSESAISNVKEPGEGTAIKSEDNSFVEDRRREKLEAYQLIHTDLLSQAEQQIQALQLTINTADQINDRQDLFFDPRIFKDEDKLKKSEDDLNWSRELSKLSSEEKAYFSKKIIEKENVYTKLSSLDKKYSFPLLLDLAVKLYGGIKLSTGGYKLSYDLVREIEDNSWWPLLEKQLKESYPQVLEQWAKNKSSALDIALVQSLGQQGTIGYFLDILDNNNGVERHGQKRLRSQLKQISKDIRAKRRRTRLVRGGEEKHAFYQEVGQKLDNDGPVWQKITDAHNLLKEHDLSIPKSLLSLYQRLKEVLNGQDAQADNKKRLRTVNLLRLIGMLAPLMPNQYANTQNDDEEDWLTFNRLFSSKAGHQVLTLVEKAIFHTLSAMPQDFWVKSGDNDAILGFLAEPSFSGLKTVINQIDQDFKSGDNYRLTADNLDDAYPADRIESLTTLYSKENENYEGLTDIFQNAINQYQKMSLDNGESARTVYWQKHPDYEILSPQDVYGYGSNVPTNTREILEGSDCWFSNWEHILSMYNAINPDDPFNKEEELKAYFADYFGFVLEKYDQTKQASKMEDVLAVALYKNNGDMSRALWDVSIFYKVLTRNNLDTGNLSIENFSGALTIKYIDDQFSYGYTASDLAKILPESKYWSTGVNGDGDELIKFKDFDPANISGMSYHIANCVALLENFPAIMVIGGVLMDFMDGSGGYNEYGSYKLETQLQYLIDNILPAQQFLENLPDNQEGVNQSDDITVIPLKPYDERLYGDNLLPVWQGLLDGGSLVLPNGKIIKLTGSPAAPLLRVSNQEHDDLFLKTQDIQITDLNVDELVHTGELINDDDSTPFQKLDSDIVVRVLEQYKEAYDPSVININSNQALEVLNILKDLHPDDWGIYVLGIPQLAESLKGNSLSDLMNKIEDRGVLEAYFQKIGIYYEDGWNKVWTAEEILKVMHEKLNYISVIDTISTCPELTEALYAGVSFSEYIETEATFFAETNLDNNGDMGYSYYKSTLLDFVIGNYDDNFDQFWSKEEIVAEILSADHTTNFYTIKRISENKDYKDFNSLLEQAPMESLLASLDGSFYGDVAQIAAYFAYRMPDSTDFNQNETEHLISVLQDNFSENWMYFVFNCPQIFSEYYKDMSFVDFINQNSEGQLEFVNYFLRFFQGEMWIENWSLDEIFVAIQQQFPETWGDLIISNTDVLLEVINEHNISLNDALLHTNYGSEFSFSDIIYYYNQCWSKQTSIDDLLQLMDEYDADRKAEDVLFNLNFFLPYFKDYSFNEFIQELGNPEESARRYVEYYFYSDVELDHLWSEKEVERAIRELYPDLYNELVEEEYFR